MCGIFGSPTITPSVQRMLPYLGIEMQTRGRDAWGASDGELVLKKKGPIVESWSEFREEIERWKQGIFHTRGASIGTAKEEQNAHPFEFRKDDGSTVIGIHNGLISNHSELDSKYGRKCQVDSEHLWMHRASGLPWSDIEGWGNLAWWETTDGHRNLHLCRFNTDSLKVCRLTQGEYIFASESKPITTIATMLGNPPKTWFSIDERHHYYFQPDPEEPLGIRLMRSGDQLEFARKKEVPVVISNPGTGGGGSNWDHWRRGPHQQGRVSTSLTYCYKCNTQRVSDDDVLCFTCLRFLLEMYDTVGADDWRA